MFADVATRAYDPAQRKPADGATAADLASRMPRLVARAHEIAASLAYGVHGRKRAGVGETFWQYRPFASGELAHRIDWRRSARGDQLYVREREWEAAHDYFLWMDCSPSMAFGSSLASDDKLSRGVTLGLALADVLVRGGERAAALGLTAPISARDVIDRLARALADNATEAARDELPPQAPIRPRARVILISDFLIDPDALAARLRRFADAGASGAVLMVTDPSEESLAVLRRNHFSRHRRRPRLLRRRRAQLARGLCAAVPGASRRRAPRGAARRLHVPAASHRSASLRSGAGARHGIARSGWSQLRGAALMFSFAAPLALFGLISLPMIYWLLRVTPPRPREIVFPPTKILRELKPDEETPAKTPWWLMALRLALAAALIFAMAGPVWAPSGVVASSAPTLVILDDGWTAAPTWERRLAGAASIIESVARAGGPVAVALASETAAPVPGDGPRAMEKLRSARPKPFLPDRKAIGEQVTAFAHAHRAARIVWISDGVAQGDAAGFVRVMKASGAAGVEVYVEDHAPRALAAPTNDAAALSVDVLRIGDERVGGRRRARRERSNGRPSHSGFWRRAARSGENRTAGRTSQRR